MKRNSATKKSLLAVGTSVTASGMSIMVNGRHIEGAILILAGIGMVLAYDHLDDKAKGRPTLPEGIDEETVKSIAAALGDAADEHDVINRLKGTTETDET